MTDVIALKARVYDLLAQKQRIDEEMVRVNQQIIQAQNQANNKKPKAE